MKKYFFIKVTAKKNKSLKKKHNKDIKNLLKKKNDKRQKSVERDIKKKKKEQELKEKKSSKNFFEQKKEKIAEYRRNCYLTHQK